MQIYGVNLNQALDKATFEEMNWHVSAEKRAKIHRFRKPIDATRSLIGDLIIRLILCGHHGFRNEEIRYAYQEFGKPYLPQHPHLHFNISHSGDWVVGVVSTSLVGIDIEKITAVNIEIPSLALTDEENKKLQLLNETDRNALFFELWTLKESYAKATGRGLSEGLNTLKISTGSGIISIEKDEKPIQAYFEMLECIEGYKFSLCSLSKNIQKDMKFFLLNDFCKEARGFLIS